MRLKSSFLALLDRLNFSGESVSRVIAWEPAFVPFVPGFNGNAGLADAVNKSCDTKPRREIGCGQSGLSSLNEAGKQPARTAGEGDGLGPVWA